MEKFDTRGRKRKYIHGHNKSFKGRKHSPKSITIIKSKRNKQVFTRETRLKMSKSRMGSKNHFWQGGIHSENLRIRGTLEYKLWHDDVLKRDNYTCVLCEAKNGSGKTIQLEVDHIKPFAFFPDDRFDLANGRTLCKRCHKNTPTWGRKAFLYA